MVWVREMSGIAGAIWVISDIGVCIFVTKQVIFKACNPKPETMNTEQKAALEQEIQRLKDSLTGNMFEDMDTRDQIHNLEMQLSGTKPMDSHFDCIGCGS